MILQALCDYYQRKEDELPAFGFEEKDIPFTIIINKAGQLINLEHNVTIEEKKQVIRQFRVPKNKSRSGAKSYEIANILWDHYGYVASQAKLSKPGLPATDKDITAANNQHTSFKKLVEHIHLQLPSDEGVKAVHLFLKDVNQINKLKAHEKWQECIKKHGTNLTFRLATETALICQSPQVIEWVKNQQTNSETKKGLCLVTGEQADIARLHDNISGVAQKPAPLASINNSAYNSYGKDKGYNFPVGIKSVFQYTTAINHLLRKKSPTKFRVGTTTYMFWSEKPSALETVFSKMFTDLPDQKDDPESGTAEIKEAHDSIYTGAYTKNENKLQFNILGLTPNVARVAVSYWKTGTVKEFSEHIAQWFADLNIVCRDHFGYPSIKKLLRHTAPQYKDDKVADNLGANVIRAVLSGDHLPETLLQATIRRIKADKGKVGYYRACIIKACINRKIRITKNTKKEKLKMSLDTENNNIGYCLGRLFAILEELQRSAFAPRKLNTPIRNKYFSAASCTPKYVFVTLLNLSKNHLRKLEKSNKKLSESLMIKKREVFGLIKSYPSQLNLEDQGFFTIGYHHQEADLYAEKIKNGEEK